MEKRWSERKELNVAVDVYQHGELLGSCHAADIGLGGTFLSTNEALSIRKDEDVDLIFRLLSEGQGTKHNVHAKVTRVTDGGVGFKFCNFDTGVFRSLQEIMSHNRATTSEARYSEGQH
jgi:hypothetical protein